MNGASWRGEIPREVARVLKGKKKEQMSRSNLKQGLGCSEKAKPEVNHIKGGEGGKGVQDGVIRGKWSGNLQRV